jgi:type II secretory ATPase GspE/PulE/Tfp pilus assembly ATPase PilB-like protein
MRAILLASSENHLGELRRLAKDAGMTSHLHEAGFLAAEGITSVQEVVRVLKGK